MNRQFTALLTVVSLLCTAPASTAQTPQEKAWYYCDPSPNTGYPGWFYPYPDPDVVPPVANIPGWQPGQPYYGAGGSVLTCPIPWRKVLRSQEPQKCMQQEEMSRTPPGTSSGPNYWTTECSEWMMLRRAEDTAARRAQEQQREAERARQEKAEGARLQAQKAAEQKSNEYAAAEQVKEAKRRGYDPISFDGFELDGKDLASHSAKIAIRGMYVKAADIEYLTPSPIASLVIHNGGGGPPNAGADQSIGLLTDNAPRNIREFFLNCRKNTGTSIYGCPITLLGHVAICTKTRLLHSTRVPCLVVEDGWK